MRRCSYAVAGIVALGLATMVSAQAGQSVAVGDNTVSAQKADQVWPQMVIDDGTHLDYLLAASSLRQAAISQLAQIAPAAGSQPVTPVVNLEHAILALEKLSRDVMSVQRDGRLDGARRIAKYHGLMARDFDIPLMARFALGRHWKRADSAQRSDYVEAFSAFLLNQYASKIAGANVSRSTVLSARRAGKRDVMVQSRIFKEDGRAFKLVWRMRQRNGQFRVIDVVAEGISMAMTKRQEFAAIMKANGGDVVPLIERLRRTSI